MSWFGNDKKIEQLFPNLKVGDAIFLKDVEWEDVGIKSGFSSVDFPMIYLKTGKAYQVFYIPPKNDKDVFIEYDFLVFKITRNYIASIQEKK